MGAPTERCHKEAESLFVVETIVDWEVPGERLRARVVVDSTGMYLGRLEETAAISRRGNPEEVR